MPVVLVDHFDNLTNWTPAGTPVLVPGVTGTAVELGGFADQLTFTVPVGYPDDIVTVRFAYRVSDMTLGGLQRQVLDLRGAGGTRSLARVVVNSNTARTAGRLVIVSGGSGIGQTESPYVIFANTWHVISVQVRIAPSPLAWCKASIDGLEVIRKGGLEIWNSLAPSNLCDRLVLQTPAVGGGVVNLFDDLVMIMGGAVVWAWDGARWQERPVHYWNGSYWQDALAVHHWDGAVWQ
jgi:hypothetical protein